MDAQDVSASTQLMKIIVGKWISKPVYVAAELGIADLLAHGPRTIAQLAVATQTNAPNLSRIMRALASVGIFAETSDKKYELTPMANLLRSGAMRSLAIMFNADWNDRAWQYLLHAVKTGEAPFEKAHGMPLTDWLEKNPGAAAVFDEANAIKASGSHRAIIDVYDFSALQTLTDVGGGVGVLLVEILKANPRLEGIVADLPAVVKKAKKIIKAEELEERCQAIECDFFKEIPPASDVYLLSNILHDWPDEKCNIILNNCHRAMKPESKLLVVEMIVPPGNEPSVTKLLDLEMLVVTGGRERTEAEYKDLLKNSGFNLNTIIAADESVSILECVKSEES